MYNLQDVGYTHVVMNLCGSYGGNQLGKIDTKLYWNNPRLKLFGQTAECVNCLTTCTTFFSKIIETDFFYSSFNYVLVVV